MKLTLANTPDKCEELLRKLEEADTISLDTESAGPLLRNRKWKNGKTFLNVHRSTMVGFSIAFPPPHIDSVPKSWRKKDGRLRAGKSLDPHGYYVPLFHNKKNATFSDAQRILEMAAERPRVWMHNAKHDAKVLALAGYPLPKHRIYDTYLASMLVDPRRDGHGLKELAADILGRESPEFDIGFYNLTGAQALEYACHDAVNTLELGEHFERELKAMNLWDWFETTESPFALVLSDMERHGLALDELKLNLLAEDCQSVMEIVLREWDRLLPDISISSSDQLQILFEEEYWRVLKKTQGGARAVDRDTMEYNLRVCEEGSIGHTAAKLRLDYQSAIKIATTYTLGLTEEAKQFPDGRIHPDYNQGGAGTGRLSSSNPNGQNIPVRSELGKRVKEAIIPRPGFVFLSADYSQIELRVLAHMAGGKLMEAYQRGEDVHQQTADLVHVSRDAGKTLNFAIVYGAGPFTLAKQLKTDKKEAQELQEAFNAAYPEVGLLMEAIVEKALCRGSAPYIKTLTGRRIYVPELISPDWKKKTEGVRKCGNAPIQGSAFDIMKIGMVNVRNKFIEKGSWGSTIRCVNNLHDEVTYEVLPSGAEYYSRVVQEILENAYRLRVPLVCEPKIGENWLATK